MRGKKGNGRTKKETKRIVRRQQQKIRGGSKEKRENQRQSMLDKGHVEERRKGGT